MARKLGNELEATVYPTLVPDSAPIAQIGGARNAIEVDTDLAGQVVFQGPGAGASPTASAVVADLIKIARGIVTGNGSTILPRPANGLSVRPIDELETRYYLRLAVTDPPAVLAEVEAVLAEHGITVDSVIHKDSESLGDRAELVLLTQESKERIIRQALQQLEELPTVHGVMLLRVEAS